jgi:hypothetical protein
MNAPLDHRETSDRYLGEIHRQGQYRVILCKDGIQWIIQRQKSGPGAAWRALSYRTSRDALLRLWASLNRAICPELLALPLTVRSSRHG